MVAERPWYIPRKCNASFLLSGVCGCTLRLRCAARFVLRIIQYRLLLPYPIWTLMQEEETNEIKCFQKFIRELDASSSNTIKEFQEFLDKWLGYIDRLEIYLTSTRGNARYSNLTQMDQYYITELRKQPEYLQSLVNNPPKFFQLLRYRSTKCELGFIRFTFKSITPQNIMTDNLEESPSIKL